MAGTEESTLTSAPGAPCWGAVMGLILAPIGLLIADPNHLATAAFSTVDSLSGFWKQSLVWRTPIGLSAFILGVAMVGVSIRRWKMPDPRTPTEPCFRSSASSFSSYGIGLCLYALLMWHLTGDAYSHWDVLIFAGSVVLIALSIGSIDRSGEGNRRNIAPLDLGIAGGIAATVGLANSIHLTAWNFSWVGDEYFFFHAAREILEGGSWNFFDLNLVFNTHPTADTLYQALVMGLFGTDIVGWRLSEVLLIAGTAAVFYLLTSSLFGRLTGIFAAAALGCNHAIIAFVHIAYNNLHSIPVHVIAILLLILCWRTGRSVFYFLLGCTLGFSFYTFMPAIMMVGVILAVLVFDIFDDPKRRSIAMFGICVFGLVLVATPALIVTPPTDFFGTVSDRTVAHPEFTEVNSTTYSRGILSLIVYWFNPGWASHYVSGSLLDHLSGLFFAVGLLASLVNFRSRLGRLALIWFSLGLFVVSATSYVDLPHFTRLIALMPAVAFLVAIGFKATFDTLATCPVFSSKSLTLIGCFLVATVVITNLLHVYLISPTRIHRNHVMLTMKVASQYPDTGIFTVGPAIDAEMHWVVEAYPEIKSRWIKTDLSAVTQSSTFECRKAKHPVYISFDKATADRLADHLPSQYLMGSEIERLSTGKEILWFFVPEAHANVDRENN